MTLLWGMGLIVVGFLISNFLAFAVGTVFTGDVEAVETLLSNPQSLPEHKLTFFALQATVQLTGFLIPSLYVIYVLGNTGSSLIAFGEGAGLEGAHKPVKVSPVVVAAVFLSALAAFPGITFLAGLNESLQFPDFLSGFGTWAREMEDRAQGMTAFMTQFDSGLQFFIALVVMAAVPALSEEFLFRGFLQGKLSAVLGNPHIAVWCSAFVFSAVHFQIFGFLPRMLLGAGFGYLYLWTRNIWIPVFAHFVNNAATVILVYMGQNGMAETGLEENTTDVPLPALLISLLVFAACYFTVHRSRRHNSEPGKEML